MLQPIKGSLLKQTIQNGYLIFIFQDYVSNTVVEAKEKIRDRYGFVPDADGYNNSDINKLQHLLFKYTGGLPKVHGFVITAPHTHWDNRKPVIYHSDKENNRYIIGPQDIYIDNIYIPVSFVFTPFGILPYEWIDNSIILNESEYDFCIKALHNTEEHITEYPYLFGISLNFRFKKSLYDFPIISVEHPVVLNNNTELAEILLVKNSADKYGTEMLDQVAWTPVPKDKMQLNQEEEEIYTAILNSMAELSDVEKIDIINNILK
ncbi:MAG: hypothetical protein IPN93_12780 [Bacteroidetes bacterium]|nr:hypothetical protein [Bacteroidota bacterium]MBK8673803.1 hypothetical protein [Bacteroidota bacterium]MBL0287886.1 hypothetical protein [Bacteroidota bacterium]